MLSWRKPSIDDPPPPRRRTYPDIRFANVPDFSLSDESKHVIKDILRSKTLETNGVLDVDELGDCLEAFGFNADDEDVDFLKKHLDENGDGELEVDELVENIDVLNWHCFHGKDLMKEFTKIDKDGDGVIRYPEMLKVLTTRGPNPLEPMEGRRLLDILARKFDANFDGKFSYSEFVKIYMSDALPYKNSLGQSHSSDDEEETAKQKEAAAQKKKKPIKKKSTGLSVPDGARTANSASSSRSAPSTKPQSSGAKSQSSGAKSQTSVAGAKSTAPLKKKSSSTTGSTTKPATAKSTKPKSSATRVQQRQSTT